MTLMNLLYVGALLFTVSAGGILLSALGAGKIPAGLVPITDRWKRDGRDPKWIRGLLWFLFFLLAVTFLAMMAVPVFPSLLQLGTRSG